MTQTKEDNKRTGRTNPRKPRKYSINVDLYRLKTAADKGVLSTSFRDSRGREYVPVYVNHLAAYVHTTPWVEQLVGKRIFRDERKQTKTFYRLKWLLMTDDSFKADVRYATGCICIKVNYAERVDKADHFKPQEEEFTNTVNVSMYHRYIQTPLDPQYETFKEAIRVEHYVQNECWFNTLTDYYKDTLMGDHKREKNKLTKEAIAKIINKTEEDFKTKGASIAEMAKVFEHFNLQVRI